MGETMPASLGETMPAGLLSQVGSEQAVPAFPRVGGAQQFQPGQAGPRRQTGASLNSARMSPEVGVQAVGSQLRAFTPVRVMCRPGSVASFPAAGAEDTAAQRSESVTNMAHNSQPMVRVAPPMRGPELSQSMQLLPPQALVVRQVSCYPSGSPGCAAAGRATATATVTATATATAAAFSGAMSPPLAMRVPLSGLASGAQSPIASGGRSPSAPVPRRMQSARLGAAARSPSPSLSFVDSANADARSSATAMQRTNAAFAHALAAKASAMSPRTLTPGGQRLGNASPRVPPLALPMPGAGSSVSTATSVAGGSACVPVWQPAGGSACVPVRMPLGSPTSGGSCGVPVRPLSPRPASVSSIGHAASVNAPSVSTPGVPTITPRVAAPVVASGSARPLRSKWFASV